MKAEFWDIDKETILKYVTEESIFSKYLGFQTISFELKYVNPLPGRKDEAEGCSFFRRDTDNKLMFHDWGKAWQADCFDVVMALYNCSFAKAINKVAADFGLSDTAVNLQPVEQVIYRTKKLPLKVNIARKNFTTQELAFWSIGGLVINQQLLENDKIFSIKAFWEVRGETVDNYLDRQNMVFAYKFTGDVGLYQIYRPEVPRARRRFINSNGLQFGDIEYLDKTQRYVVITKSKKDAFFLRVLGVNAFFIVHEGVVLPPDMMHKLKTRYERVLTLFDNDLTGMRLSVRYKMLYQTEILMYSRHEGKDTYQMLKFFGAEYMRDLINHMKTMLDT